MLGTWLSSPSPPYSSSALVARKSVVSVSERPVQWHDKEGFVSAHLRVSNTMYQNPVVAAFGGDVSYDAKETLKEPYSYLLQIPGKAVRSRLIEAFDEWLHIPGAVLLFVGTCCC